MQTMHGHMHALKETCRENTERKNVNLAFGSFSWSMLSL